MSTPPLKLQQWITILHNAAKVGAGHPRYAEARQVAQIALDNIRSTNEAANDAENPDISPGKGKAAIAGMAQGITSGFADEIVGTMLAARDRNTPFNRQNVDASIQGVRGAYGEARSSHPIVAGVANIAGAIASPINRLTGPLTKGLSAGYQGAIQGGVLGGAQGFGEGDGSVRERLPSAGAGAAAGAIAGGVLGKIIAKLSPVLRVIAKNVRSALGGSASAPQIAAVTSDASERAIRAQLTKQNYPADAIEQVVAAWNAKTAPPVEVPVVQRPGETITQIARNGFEVTGPRVTPKAPTTPTLAEMQGFGVRDLGKGQTLPYYPRGGQVEQSVAPPPAQSAPALAPNQNAAFLEYLKAATREDAGSRIATLRALGVPLGPNAEAELLQLLGIR